ncbi:MAG: hypothetical protein LBV04_00555 [Deferribacteraceae bacterium]|jgi:hypothetical protein|nr:hypothetical protein [Deferribacteraceae bacterium]
MRFPDHGRAEWWLNENGLGDIAACFTETWDDEARLKEYETAFRLMADAGHDLAPLFASLIGQIVTYFEEFAEEFCLRAFSPYPDAVERAKLLLTDDKYATALLCGYDILVGKAEPTVEQVRQWLTDDIVDTNQIVSHAIYAKTWDNTDYIKNFDPKQLATVLIFHNDDKAFTAKRDKLTERGMPRILAAIAAEYPKEYLEVIHTQKGTARNNLIFCINKLPELDNATLTKLLNDKSKKLRELAQAVLAASGATPTQTTSKKTSKAGTKALLNAKYFVIHVYEDDDEYDIDAGKAACQQLIDGWNVELEAQLLDGLMDIYEREDWAGIEEDILGLAKRLPKVKTHADFIKRIKKIRDEGGCGGWLPNETADYGESFKSKKEVHGCLTFTQDDDGSIECILHIDCPWDYEIGWGAAFVNNEFVEAKRGIQS